MTAPTKRQQFSPTILSRVATGSQIWFAICGLCFSAGCQTPRIFDSSAKFPESGNWAQPVQDDQESTTPPPSNPDVSQLLIRAQDPGTTPQANPNGAPAFVGDPYATSIRGNQAAANGTVTLYGTQDVPGNNVTPLAQPGDPNSPNLLPSQFLPGGIGRSYFDNTADLDVYVQESQTGRIMIGGAYNSDAGLTGQITIDERNFDIARYPRSFRDIVDGRAFRGAGQGFRLELLPGRQVQRYLVSLTEPYLFNTLVSLNSSAYFYNRRFFDWEEQRLGGQFSLGYRLTPELSVSAGTRLENVDIYDPRVGTSPQLNSAVGDHALFLGFARLVHDTRDHPFLATEGAYLELSYTQAFGDFDYPRGDIDYRRYFLIYQRPDGSGRHTVSFGTRLGVTGSDTPIFENYFAGGFSTMRGFSFRGASPVEGGVRVGGEFQWLNSLEYMFPLSADDMIRGVVFCDFGTIEEDVRLTAENFRVAPGIGLRIHMPAAGAGGAPLAFDFAFPIAEAATDDRQMFSFYMSVNR